MVLDSRALGIWMSILPESLFFRVHRTAFVNVLHVSDVDRSKPDKWLIKMRAIQQSWPVSRVYRKPLRERLGV
jgi:DNA-binding LytR/AlgR family response regulator